MQHRASLRCCVCLQHQQRSVPTPHPILPTQPTMCPRHPTHPLRYDINYIWLACPGAGVELTSDNPRCQRLGSHLATCTGYKARLLHPMQPPAPECTKLQTCQLC